MTVQYGIILPLQDLTLPFKFTRPFPYPLQYCYPLQDFISTYTIVKCMNCGSWCLNDN